MGQEAECKVRFKKRSSEGRALLETREILFRGDFRLKIPFAQMKSVKAEDGELSVETDEGVAIFELGKLAEKWREKILHPKSRMEKLGVKPGARISLIGEFGPDFRSELQNLTDAITHGKAAGESDLIFFSTDSSRNLSQIARLAKSMKGAMALWIIYPKGQRDITENHVLTAGRKAGLKDVKVVGFSATHTALKFVLPLSTR